METVTADWVIRAFVLAAIGYFVWKFKKLDSFATREEVQQVKKDLETDCAQCDAHDIGTILESHRQEQKADSAHHAEQLHDHIRGVKQDLGREIGEVKQHQKTLDSRLYALAIGKPQEAKG